MTKAEAKMLERRHQEAKLNELIRQAQQNWTKMKMAISKAGLCAFNDIDRIEITEFFTIYEQALEAIKKK